MKRAAGGVLIACGLSLVLALCLQASGAIIVFTSRDEWTSANNGDVDFLQSFNALNFNLPPGVRKDIAFPGFSILQEPGFAMNFAGSADVFASDTTPLFLAFNFPLFGFGADFEILEGTLELDPVGIPSERRALSPTTGFFGILSDLPFNAINFTNFSGATRDLQILADDSVHIRLNNVSLAQVTPEPVSLIIWGAGFLTTAGYVAIRRHWRQQCGKV